MYLEYKITEIKRKRVIMSLVFAFICLVCLTAIGFSSARLIKISATMREQKIFLEERVAQSKTLSQVSKDLLSYEAKMLPLESSYADSENKLEFLNTIEDMAKKENLSIEMTLSNDKAEEISQGISRVPFYLVAQGNTAGLINFVQSFENTGYYINIKHAKLSSIGSQENKTSLIVQADTYWR